MKPVKYCIPVIIVISWMMAIPVMADEPQIIPVDMVTGTYGHVFPADLAILPDGSILSLFGVFQSTANGYQDIKTGDVMMSVSDNGGLDWPPETLDLQHGDNLTIIGVNLLATSNGTIFKRYIKYESSDNATLWVARSDDGGKNYNEPVFVDTGHAYNECTFNGIELKDGTLVFPFSFSENQSGSYWKSSVIFSSDNGSSWQVGGVIDHAKPKGNGCDEPSIVELSSGDIYALVRTDQGQLYFSKSNSACMAWSPAKPSGLVSPCVCACLYRYSWEPNRILVAWNNAIVHRYPLVLAESTNDCTSWSQPMKIADAGYNTAYPHMTANSDNALLISWWDNPQDKVNTIKSVFIPSSLLTFAGAYSPPAPPATTVPGNSGAAFTGAGGGGGGYLAPPKTTLTNTYDPLTDMGPG